MAVTENIKEKLETLNENSINDNLAQKYIITEDSISKNVKEKLRSLNIDYDELSKKVQEYLYRIESIISDKTATQNEAFKMIKSATFNLNSIAETMGISRTTLYNNKTLELYIKYSKEVFEQDDPYIAFDKLKASKAELEKQIDGFLDRDIECEILKQEISALNTKLAEKEKQVQVLIERRKILAAENKTLENKIRRLKEQSGIAVAPKVTPLNNKVR